MKPSTLFPSLSLLSIITDRLMLIIRIFQQYGTVLSSIGRVQAFLLAQEVQVSVVEDRLIHLKINHSMLNDSADSPDVEQTQFFEDELPNQDQLQLVNGSVSFKDTRTPLFKQVSISIPRGKLSVIMGATGSGKSQLLRVLLDEVTKSAGQLFVEPGTSIIYCGQKVWLQHKSIKANIVGDHEFDINRYLDVISRCELEEDLIALPGGHDAMVGGNITILSNSQLYKVVSTILSIRNNNYLRLFLGFGKSGLF